jgi:hypothetical protein
VDFFKEKGDYKMQLMPKTTYLLDTDDDNQSRDVMVVKLGKKRKVEFEEELIPSSSSVEIATVNPHRVCFVTKNTDLTPADTFTMVNSTSSLMIRLPPLNSVPDGVLKLAIHNAYANVTHFVKTSGDDYFLSREGKGQKTYRLGVDGKTTFVGKNNIWFLC